MGSSSWAGARFALVALSVAIATGLFQPRARATVMVEVPLETMIREADAIVVGVVEQVGARLVMRQDGAEPHTITTLRVREWVKGSGGALVRIDELGGTVAQRSTRIAGTPEYTPGEEVVVFLRRTPEGALRTFAMVQGRFGIRRGVPGADDVVVRDTSAVGFASWASGPMAIDHGGVRAMRLDDFLGYVRATLEQSGAVTPGGSTDPVGGAR